MEDFNNSSLFFHNLFLNGIEQYVLILRHICKKKYFLTFFFKAQIFSIHEQIESLFLLLAIIYQYFLFIFFDFQITLVFSLLLNGENWNIRYRYLQTTMINQLAKPLLRILPSQSFSTLRSTSFVSGTYSQLHQSLNIDQQKIQFSNGTEIKKTSFNTMNSSSQFNPALDDFDPFKVLNIPQNSSKEKIRQAYKEIVRNCHPKRNSSLQASEKFIIASRAYEILTKRSDKASAVSYAGQFQKHVKDLLNSQAGIVSNFNQELKQAQLYTSSTKVKKFGNTKQVSIQKQYNKNGKLVLFTRVEKFKSNGTVEVSQIFDDGVNLKTNLYNIEAKKQN